ncbi:MAG: phosphoenolpyruvate carboxykinase (ATP) [Saprospiraceae bacterium]|nr:phosphoenolpyruvate carboxykinase (ATP) [Saprospiraceae bacterium]
MSSRGTNNLTTRLSELGIKNPSSVYDNLTPSELIEHSVCQNQGTLSDMGALAIDTGEFTGRSPKDRFIVKDDITANSVDWGNINLPFDADAYKALRKKVVAYFENKSMYLRDVYACADDRYRMNIQVVTEYAWSNLFVNNMFLCPTAEELKTFSPEWTIICAPGFHAEPTVDGTRQHNFAILNFTEKEILIGGTGYTGEMKKGIFSALNFILPHQKETLSMHCSANVGADGDTAIFFGLSGTGKTTLSADPERNLIGDDEHGWSKEGVFNFEGGCYAKCIDLTEEKEPDIFKAIKHGALLENIIYEEGTRTVDFSRADITENTRVSYPIYHINNALPVSKAGHPTNIFFLTCDAFGVLPPISKLTPGQAMFHFISGYTAKVAGTEEGITEPQVTFSACFGAPFMPLHPTAYAEMLGKKMEEHGVNVWLVNTGWTGGEYGVGNRMKLKYTRAMITAALNDELEHVSYSTHEVFGLLMPNECTNVPADLLHPRNTWTDKEAYDKKANHLANLFNKNFEKFADKANEEILEAAPQATTVA